MNPVPCPHIVVYPSDIGGHLLDYPGWLSVDTLDPDSVEVDIYCASNLGDAEVVLGRSLPGQCEQPFVELHSPWAPPVHSRRSSCARLLGRHGLPGERGIPTGGCMKRACADRARDGRYEPTHTMTRSCDKQPPSVSRGDGC